MTDWYSVYRTVDQGCGLFLPTAELTKVFRHNLKANKSSVLSVMPLQILKHMGPAGVKCMATFLNKSTVD